MSTEAVPTADYPGREPNIEGLVIIMDERTLRSPIRAEWTDFATRFSVWCKNLQGKAHSSPAFGLELALNLLQSGEALRFWGV